MTYKLSSDEIAWIDEQIRISSLATPQQRLLYLSDLQDLYQIAAQQKKRKIDIKEFETLVCSGLEEKIKEKV